MKTWFSGRWLIFAAHAVYGLLAANAPLGAAVATVAVMSMLGLLAAATAPDALFESPGQIGWVIFVAIVNAALVVPCIMILIAMLGGNAAGYLYFVVFVWVLTGPLVTVLAWIGAWIIGVWFPPNAWMNDEATHGRFRQSR